MWQPCPFPPLRFHFGTMPWGNNVFLQQRGFIHRYHIWQPYLTLSFSNSLVIFIDTISGTPASLSLSPTAWLYSSIPGSSASLCFSNSLALFDRTKSGSPACLSLLPISQILLSCVCVFVSPLWSEQLNGDDSGIFPSTHGWRGSTRTYVRAIWTWEGGREGGWEGRREEEATSLLLPSLSLSCISRAERQTEKRGREGGNGCNICEEVLHSLSLSLSLSFFTGNRGFPGKEAKRSRTTTDWSVLWYFSVQVWSSGYRNYCLAPTPPPPIKKTSFDVIKCADEFSAHAAHLPRLPPTPETP